MTLLLWALFGVITGLTIHALDAQKQTGRLMAAILGAAGAVSGGLCAYFFFSGNMGSINSTTIVLMVVEASLLVLLLSGKAFHKMQ